MIVTPAPFGTIVLPHHVTKAHRYGRPASAGLLLLALLAACKPAPGNVPEATPAPAQVDRGCGPDGGLATELFGSIARPIRWSANELECESMLRPNGMGVRLRFTGESDASRLAIILALPELTRGDVAAESPTVVTLTVEGSGRFFSTPSTRSCWSDIAAQDLIDDGGDRYDIRGTVYCVAPLGEINGSAAITIPKLEFRGIIDWSSTG